MDEVWTDRNELDRITQEFEEEYYDLKATIQNINDLAPSCKIGNIGLYSGNKMRSMYKRYKEHNVDYASSKVNKAIETYFVFQYDNALYALKRLAYKMKSQLGDYGPTRKIREFILNSSDIEYYKKTCEEIYQFDMERDAVDAINYVLDNVPLLFGMNVNDIIDDYNEELKKLGIEQSIQHRVEVEDNENAEDEIKYLLNFVLGEIIQQLNGEEQKDSNQKTKIKNNKESNKE